MKWIKVISKQPIHSQDILFITGDSEIHLGFFDVKQKRFTSYIRSCDWYECDLSIPKEDRVIYWCEIPELPKDLK